MPNPEPGSSAAGESGAEPAAAPGDAMPEPDPASCVAGESGADPGDAMPWRGRAEATRMTSTHEDMDADHADDGIEDADDYE